MGSRLTKLTFIISIVYFLVVSIFLVWHRIWFSPDQFFAAALLITWLIGRVKQFLQDWSIPTIVFLGYEYLRGLVPKLTPSAHIFPMINFDKSIFGNIPTIKLQQLFFSSQNGVSWYDYLATFFYMSHFISPMIVGFIFWFHARKLFSEFSFSLLLLSYTAFITYIIFPAMPPWMASQQGYLPHMDKIMDLVFLNFPQPIHLPTVYKYVGANLVAAVPSLHAAYPWLIFLFMFKKVKTWSLLLLPYVFGVWFSIVYLGEHYVFDIVAGVFYASAVFYLMEKRVKVLLLMQNLRHFLPTWHKAD